VKVLDIDRERQRISLGLKQTQTDPWQQVLESYQEGDVVQGKVTKVVTFGAFVEILPGVEGLVHISELAQHHVENPREVVSQGDTVNVRILEVDAERRRLSLSLKRVEDGMPVQPKPGDEALPPAIDLSENVFADEAVATEHDLLAEDAEARAAIRGRWGEDAVDDRGRIGEIVFADPDELEWLEQLLHPRVALAQRAWLDELAQRAEPPALAVVEIPLLFETGGEERFDAVVVVTAPLELRERRRGSFAAREARLVPEAEKVRRADFAYVNDGSLEELDAFVAGVVERLSSS